MTTNQSSNLRPCPFCGESSRVEINTYTEQIVCGQCGAVVYYKYWDTRPIEDDLRKRIAKLEAFIDRIIEAGDAMSNAQSMWVAEEGKWDALVKDWKERER